MNNAIFRYRNQLVSLTPEKVKDIYYDLEKSLRTGVFNYRKTALTKNQYDQMKREWSPETMEFFKQNAQKLAGQGKVTPEIAYQAAVNTVMEFVLENRVNNAAIRLSKTSLQRTISFDIALSSMFDVAFNTTNTIGNDKVISGKRIEGKYTLQASVFTIPCDKVDNSDIFVFSMYNEQINTSYLIGWKAQNEVRATRRGNKKTDSDNCPWPEMSFYFNYPELNPMSDLAIRFGLKELPENVLLEQVTQIHYLPIVDSGLTQGIILKKPQKQDDYYKILGLTQPESSAEKTEKSVEKAKEVLKNDDWEM